MKNEAYREKYEQLIRENEGAANIVVAKLLFVVAAVYILVGFLMTFKVFSGPAGIIATLFVSGVIFAGLSALKLFIKIEKKMLWLKYAYIGILLLSVFFLNVLVGYKAWLLYAVPIFLSVRYYNRRITAAVGVFAMILTVCSVFTNAYLAPIMGMMDLNLVSFNQPGTLNYYSWLHNAVINHGYDAAKLVSNGLRISAIPNCLMLLLIVFISESVISNGVRILMKESENCTQQISLIRNALTDGLTGLLNRRAFNDDLEDMGKNYAENLLAVSFDVDGLKNVNDTLGQDAGDELIRGAAQCIRTSFELYGKVYRVGGDEFAAIIEADEEQFKHLKEVFDKTVVGWTGSRVGKMTVSLGYARISEADGSKKPENMVKLAEKRMYLEKEIHYASSRS